MIDEAIQIDKKLTPAQAAVRYMLERIRVDADLRWHLLNTEALVRLTLAEAVRTGGTRHAVEAHYTTPADHCREDKPKLVEARARIMELEGRVAELTGAVSTLKRRLSDALDDDDDDDDDDEEENRSAERAEKRIAAFELCPTCHGLPAEAITRCPVCRALQCGDIENALELCPACAGLGIDAVSRCPMCRKLLEAL